MYVLIVTLRSGYVRCFGPFESIFAATTYIASVYGEDQNTEDNFLNFLVLPLVSSK